jgi:beta-galactosidase GanA
MDGNACKYTASPFSFLEEVAGVYTKYQLPLQTEMPVKTRENQRFTLTTYFHAFETKGSDAYAVYDGGEFDGLAAVTIKQYGKGEIVLVGGVLPQEELLSLVGKKPILEASENIHLTQRTGTETGIIAVETKNEQGFVVLDNEYLELLSGNRVSGKVEIPPYGVRVFKKVQE